jgi:molecular chaperone GrpE
MTDDTLDRNSEHAAAGSEEELLNGAAPRLEEAADPADEELLTSEDLEDSLEAEMQYLAERLAESQRIAADNNDKFLRAVADLDNYRRRARQEMDEVRKFGNEQLISDLLGVLDNFERAVQAAETSQNAEALRDGVSLIHRQLLDTLAKAGLEPIEALHQPFDPTLHEAIMQVEAEEHEPNTVVEELRKGYQLHGRLIRPSLVKVSG